MQADIRLPENLGIRPARDHDAGFLENLYRSSRDDLRLIEGEDDFIEEIILMQHRAQTLGYGETHPNAMYFIVEKLGERIGRIIVDFGHNEVRLIDITLIPAARGKGYGNVVIKALQQAAHQARTPLTLSVHHGNPLAKRLYQSLGFQAEPSNHPMVELMVWYPPGS